MSQENVEQVAAFVEAMRHRDREGLSELLHPDFEFHAAIGAVEQRVYAGADGMWAFVSDMDATWDGYRVALEEVHDGGERAVAVMHITGTARVSGIPLDQRLGQLITWRDGRIWRQVAYPSPAEALNAVGLPE